MTDKQVSGYSLDCAVKMVVWILRIQSSVPSSIPLRHQLHGVYMNHVFHLAVIRDAVCLTRATSKENVRQVNTTRKGLV